ncbi:hypothetical protein ACFQRK_21505 [Parapedobacter sp. GCM10030251]|uniref:hypothetical protein n=1 Tax=Parapedobacter sp. GCM10030251 TaxID=3273419 RepID=UPI0036071A66
MKRNVLKWVLMLAVCGLTTGAFAQSKLTDEQKEELLAKMEQYRAELNLSDEQQEMVKSINTAYFEGLAGLKASEGSKLSKFKKYRTLSETRDEQMKQVLDKDQYKRYKEMQKEMKGELKSRRK